LTEGKFREGKGRMRGRRGDWLEFCELNNVSDSHVSIAILQFLGEREVKGGTERQTERDRGRERGQGGQRETDRGREAEAERQRERPREGGKSERESNIKCRETESWGKQIKKRRQVETLSSASSSCISRKFSSPKKERIRGGGRGQQT
jgi:hypothetical protein